MANDIDTLIADVQSYVVAPVNAFGLGGFVFDALGEDTARLDAEITDHYTEDNKSFQDQIAIRPKKITLRGYVGELTCVPSNPDPAILQQAVQKLTTLSSYAPILSASAQQLIATSTAGQLPDLTLSDTANIYGLIKNLIPQATNSPKQQQAYNYFKSCMSQKILMAVQTPWEFMTNMAIESVIAIQPEGSDSVTDFAVTYKEIRIAKTQTVAYTTNLAGQSSSSSNLSPQSNASALAQYRAENGLSTPPIDQQLQGVAAVQAAPLVQQGNIPGVSLPTTSLPGWQSQLTDVNSIVTNPGAMAIFHAAGAQ